MSGQVKVEDFEIFRLFRVALHKFAQAAGQSLTNADSQIARTRSWLENEQLTFWQGQLRKRSEALVKAREAVRQKKLFKDSSGRTPSAVEEEKAMAKCQAALEQAQQKIEAVRKWLPKLEKEAEMYRGGVSRLGGSVSVDVPRAIALLDRLAGSLEQYVQIDAPTSYQSDSGMALASEDSISRGDDAAPETPPPANTTVGSATDAGPATTQTDSPTQTPPSKEGLNVTHGQ